ncbi:hypothetical protein JHW43_005456 [Diplocarpon mali]|nr:hypothetical protein JHW43_005456 [Diplocarpon mali]
MEHRPLDTLIQDQIKQYPQLKPGEEPGFTQQVYVSPPLVSSAHRTDLASSHHVGKQELASLGIPLIHAGPWTLPGSVSTSLTRVLSRSPRSNDLVGLLRRNSMQGADSEGGEGVAMCDMEQNAKLSLDKGNGKATASEAGKLAGPARLPHRLSTHWNEHDSGMCKAEENSYSFSDADFDMSTPQDACKYQGKYPPPAKFTGWSDSPTCGRGNVFGGSGVSYSNMDIGELMRGMEVDSDDTDDDIPDDMPKLLAFQRQKPPGVKSSTIFSRHEKRRADPGLASPVKKRRHAGKGDRRVVSLARPLQGEQDMLFGSC